jgi:hypothetical protein
MLELLKYCTSGFWVFVGTFCFISLFITGFLRLIIRTFRLIVVLLKGWPPSHLDADGDWKPEPNENK